MKNIVGSTLLLSTKVFSLIRQVPIKKHGSEDSGESAHMCRLTWAFAAHLHEEWIEMKTQAKS